MPVAKFKLESMPEQNTKLKGETSNYYIVDNLKREKKKTKNQRTGILHFLRQNLLNS